MNIPRQTSFLTPSQSSWFPQVWRLIRWYLFISRRRLMAPIMLILFLLGYIFILAVQFLIYKVSGPAVATTVRLGFTFPITLIIIEEYLSVIGPLFLCILASTVIGSEYSLGIQRQLLSRGMDRFQVMTAQIVAMAIIASVTTFLTLLLGTLVGVILGPLLHAPLLSLSAQGWLGLVLFWLSITFYLLVYMLIAILMTTLGHSLIAGLAFSLGTVLLEGVATNILGFFIYSSRGQPLGSILMQLYQLFPSSSGSIIISATSNMIQPSSGLDRGGLGQAIIIHTLYCLILILGSYLFYTSRDITE